eukprot:1374862-Amphidinium_carterae.1
MLGFLLVFALSGSKRGWVGASHNLLEDSEHDKDIIKNSLAPFPVVTARSHSHWQSSTRNCKAESGTGSLSLGCPAVLFAYSAKRLVSQLHFE